MYSKREDLHSCPVKVRLTPAYAKLLEAAAEINGLQPAVQLRIWIEEAMEKMMAANHEKLCQEFDRRRAG